MSTVLSPDRILKQLAELWVGMAKEQSEEPHPTGAGVLRACTMTLVVLAEETEDLSALGETIAALMPEHPARTIMIRLHGDGGRTLEDRVYAQCWMPFGQRRQICCEQVEITASDAALADLPAVVLPLAVADVPLMVWCRAARLLGKAEFRRIAGMATRVVLDSGLLPDARSALRSLAGAANGTPIGDLAWTRLTRWREMLSQVFENRERLAQISAINAARVTFGAGFETAAWYMAAWIADGLEQAGALARTSVAPDAAVPTMRVELAGEGLRIALSREQDRLVATVNDISQCTNLPQPGDYILMREELGIVRRDPVFERTLASAVRLAYAGQS